MKKVMKGLIATSLAIVMMVSTAVVSFAGSSATGTFAGDQYAKLKVWFDIYGSSVCYASANSSFEMDMHISGWAKDLNNGTVWFDGREDWTYGYQVSAHDSVGFKFIHADFELWSETGYSYESLEHEESFPL